MIHTMKDGDLVPEEDRWKDQMEEHIKNMLLRIERLELVDKIKDRGDKERVHDAFNRITQIDKELK